MSQQPAAPAKDALQDLSVTWHALSAEDVLTQLDTVKTEGLTSEEAERRLKLHGPNQLQEKPRPTFLKLLFDQLKSFVIILLIVASIISAILGEWVDAGAIILIVVLNAVLGVVQESKAEEALAALKKMAAPEAHGIRDGKRVSIPAINLVPGDIVLLEAGNFVPSDLRLVEAINFVWRKPRLRANRFLFKKTPQWCWKEAPTLVTAKTQSSWAPSSLMGAAQEW